MGTCSINQVLHKVAPVNRRLNYQRDLRPLPFHITSRLPLGLIERFLDQAKMDRPTLFVCLRVCHFWHRYAIDTLYEPVYISSRRQLARLADVARKFPSVRSRLAFTRTVLIAQLPCVAEFTHTFPLLLGRYLPTLGHISFLNYNHIAGPISITFYASIPLYSSVTRLSLVKFTSTYGNFLRVFCAFPQLKHLDVQEGSLLPLSPLAIRLVLPGPQGNVRLCHAPKLERLVLIQLDEGFLDKLVQWLLSTDLYITIRALEISQDLHRFDPWLRPLYEHIGPALQYLRMENVDNSAKSSPALPHVSILMRKLCCVHHW